MFLPKLAETPPETKGGLSKGGWKVSNPAMRKERLTNESPSTGESFEKSPAATGSQKKKKKVTCAEPQGRAAVHGATALDAPGDPCARTAPEEGRATHEEKGPKIVATIVGILKTRSGLLLDTGRTGHTSDKGVGKPPENPPKQRGKTVKRATPPGNGPTKSSRTSVEMVLG